MWIYIEVDSMRTVTIGVIQSSSTGVEQGEISVGTVSTFAFYEPAGFSVGTTSVIATYEPIEISVSYLSAMAFLNAASPATGQCDVATLSPIIWHRKTRQTKVGTIAPIIWHRKNRQAKVGTLAAIIFYRPA